MLSTNADSNTTYISQSSTTQDRIYASPSLATTTVDTIPVVTPDRESRPARMRKQTDFLLVSAKQNSRKNPRRSKHAENKPQRMITSKFDARTNSRKVARHLVQHSPDDAPKVELCHAGSDKVAKSFDSVHEAAEYCGMTADALWIRVIAGPVPKKAFYWRLAAKKEADVLKSKPNKDPYAGIVHDLILSTSGVTRIAKHRVGLCTNAEDLLASKIEEAIKELQRCQNMDNDVSVPVSKPAVVRRSVAKRSQAWTKRCISVDKICVSTCRVLESFKTTKEAFLSVGLKGTSSCVVGALREGTLEYRGFYWRYATKRVAAGSRVALQPICVMGDKKAVV